MSNQLRLWFNLYHGVICLFDIDSCIQQQKYEHTDQTLAKMDSNPRLSNKRLKMLS